MQIPENHDKTFLEHIFRIGHGFRIPIANPQHTRGKMLIQLLLSSRLPFKTVFYQLVIIHSSFVTKLTVWWRMLHGNLSVFLPPMAISLTERDRQVIWHPYTQHKNNLPPIPAIRGEGSLLFDDNGNTYIDAISSWWTTIHGHAHPYIAEKVYAQAQQLEHVIFTGFTHEPAVQLANGSCPCCPARFPGYFILTMAPPRSR